MDVFTFCLYMDQHEAFTYVTELEAPLLAFDIEHSLHCKLKSQMMAFEWACVQDASKLQTTVRPKQSDANRFYSSVRSGRPIFPQNAM